MGFLSTSTLLKHPFPPFPWDHQPFAPKRVVLATIPASHQHLTPRYPEHNQFFSAFSACHVLTSVFASDFLWFLIWHTLCWKYMKESETEWQMVQTQIFHVTQPGEVVIKLLPLVELWPHPDRSSIANKTTSCWSHGTNDESLVKNSCLMFFVLLHPLILWHVQT